MPKHIKVNYIQAQGRTKFTLQHDEYKSLVINGFIGEDRSDPYKFYKSLLDHLKKIQRFGGMTWAKNNKEWIGEQFK